jgi:hypothetical protein
MNIQHPTLNIEVEENEDATSLKGSAGVPPAVSRILRDSSPTPGRAMRPRSADSFRKDSPPEAAEEMFKCER